MFSFLWVLPRLVLKGVLRAVVQCCFFVVLGWVGLGCVELCCVVLFWVVLSCFVLCYVVLICFVLHHTDTYNTFVKLINWLV